MANSHTFEVEVSLADFNAFDAVWSTIPERCNFITEKCSDTFLIEIAHSSGTVEAWEGPCNEAADFADMMPSILGRVAAENGITEVEQFYSISFWFTQRADAMRFALEFGGAA